jgi:hypothetical protein
MNTITCLGVLGLIAFIIALINYLDFRIRVYFHKIQLKGHPFLEQGLVQVITNICEKEALQIFSIPYDELNEKNETRESKALGLYYNLIDQDDDLRPKLTEAYNNILDLEAEYKMPIEVIGKQLNINIVKRHFVFPRIEICNEADRYYNANMFGYYFTLLHEIGHHLARKFNASHTEADADLFAGKIVKENLPSFYMLFLAFDARLGDIKELKLSFFKRIIAYYQYMQYLKEKKAHEKK